MQIKILQQTYSMNNSNKYPHLGNFFRRLSCKEPKISKFYIHLKSRNIYSIRSSSLSSQMSSFKTIFCLRFTFEILISMMRIVLLLKFPKKILQQYLEIKQLSIRSRVKSKQFCKRTTKIEHLLSRI